MSIIFYLTIFLNENLLEEKLQDIQIQGKLKHQSKFIVHLDEITDTDRGVKIDISP